jgi:hypothetical protein
VYIDKRDYLFANIENILFCVVPYRNDKVSFSRSLLAYFNGEDINLSSILSTCGTDSKRKAKSSALAERKKCLSVNVM